MVVASVILILSTPSFSEEERVATPSDVILA